VIGEATIVRDSREWRRRTDNRRRSALHHLHGAIVSRRHAVRLAKLAREMHRVHIHRSRERRNRGSRFDVVEQSPSTNSQDSIRALSRAEGRQ